MSAAVLLPFGELAGDDQLSPGSDSSFPQSKLVSFGVPCPFYGVAEDTIFVSIST